MSEFIFIEPEDWNALIARVDAIEAAGALPHTLDSHSDVADITEAEGMLLAYLSSTWDGLARGSDNQYLKSTATSIAWEALNIVEDTTPTLGGDLNCNNKNLTSINSATIADEGDNEGFMGPANAWGFHHPSTAQGGYDAVEITIDDPFQVKYGSTKILELSTGGALTISDFLVVDSGEVKLLSTAADNFTLQTKTNTPNPNFAIKMGGGLTWISGNTSGQLNFPQGLSAALDMNTQNIGALGNIDFGSAIKDCIYLYGTTYGIGISGSTLVNWADIQFEWRMDLRTGTLIMQLHETTGLTLLGTQGNNTNVNTFSTDGTLVGNSDDAVPTEKAVKTYVDGAGGVPSGLIAMWSGTIANIPTGWSLCDGGDTRPDLRSKFVRGARTGYDPGGIGGSDTHTLAVGEMPAHTHTQQSCSNPGNHNGHWGDDREADGSGTAADNIHYNKGGHTHSIVLNNTGGGAAHENRPSYLELAFIWKD